MYWGEYMLIFRRRPNFGLRKMLATLLAERY